MGFRHTHGLQFNRSDLYFVCRLKPSDDCSNSVPVAQEGEIAAAAWIPLDEFREMVFGDKGHPMMQIMVQLLDKSGECDIQRDVVSSIVPGRKPSPVYHAKL